MIEYQNAPSYGLISNSASTLTYLIENDHSENNPRRTIIFVSIMTVKLYPQKKNNDSEGKCTNRI